MLLYKYTEAEVKELLKSLVIICDTREQKNNHIINWLDTKKIPHVSRKLEHGDYSCYLPANESMGIYRDTYLTNIVSIERKANLGELSGNLTKDRARLESEFIRTRGKLYLLIENATYGDIVAHKYPTQYNPKSFIASLKTFEARYNIHTVYMPNAEYTASFIYQTLAYHTREKLLYG